MDKDDSFWPDFLLHVAAEELFGHGTRSDTGRGLAVISPFLPSERGRNCRPAHDNRLVLAGMLRILKSRGGFTSKIHLRADGLGRPIDFLVTGGRASDSRQLKPLLALAAAIRRPDFLLGDKGYDSDDNRGSLLIRGVGPVIPSMRSRKVEIRHDEALHRQRNRIERMIGKLKQSRRVATRYDKTMSSYRGSITMAAIKL